jgi:hypothetical protein
MSIICRSIKFLSICPSVLQHAKLRKRIKDEDNLRFYPISAYSVQRIEVWNGVGVCSAPNSFII